MAIELIRIDDRLIHGQVVTQWLPHTGANNIIVIDDQLAADPFLSAVNKGLAPAGVGVHIITETQAAGLLRDMTDNPSLKTLVLVRTPLPLLRLLKSGQPVQAVNLGGMGMREGRSQLYKGIAADPEERAAFSTLMEQGVKVGVQVLPSDPAADLGKFI